MREGDGSRSILTDKKGDTDKRGQVEEGREKQIYPQR